MGEIIDLDEDRFWREIGREERAMIEAIKKALVVSGDEKDILCPNAHHGIHNLHFYVKRKGQLGRGEVKAVWYCDVCQLGGEGYLPAGQWANETGPATFA